MHLYGKSKNLSQTQFPQNKALFCLGPNPRKDEDWDSAYLFEIMRFKISRIRKEVEKNKRHIGYEKDVRDMKVAEELLNRIAFSDFHWELSQALESLEKAGKCSCAEETWNLEPCSYDVKTEDPTSFRHIDLSCEYCKQPRSRWIKRQKSKEKEDYDFLFRHLQKKAQRWWD